MSRISYLWGRYQWNLKHRPYRTNACTASSISMVGDILAQTVFKRAQSTPQQQGGQQQGPSSSTPRISSPWQVQLPNKHGDVVDLRRSLVFGSFSALFGTPFWLLVYKMVDKGIPTVTIRTAIQKGMITWVLANSTNPIFIAYVTTADHLFIKQGRFSDLWGNHATNQSNKILEKIKRDLPVVMSYSICFWSIQWIPMFYLLPPHFRILYSSSLQIVWSGLVSHLLHKNPETVPGAALHS